MDVIICNIVQKDIILKDVIVILADAKQANGNLSNDMQWISLHDESSNCSATSNLFDIAYIWNHFGTFANHGSYDIT